MSNLEKKHDYLLFIDSDGTIMNTMNDKHIICFGPIFIKVFDIKSHVEEILIHWNNTNLYTQNRGMNRFQGLREIVLFTKQFGYEFEGFDEYLSWLDEATELSNEAIEKELISHPHNSFFKKALTWSSEVNKSISELPPSNYFNNMPEILNKLSNVCDLIAVSAANKEAINEAFDRLHLKKYFQAIYTQEDGDKADLIAQILGNGYDKKNCMIIGDSISDYKAGLDNEIYFYPIIPGHEIESWIRLDDALRRLLEHKIDEVYQLELINDFYQNLK